MQTDSFVLVLLAKATVVFVTGGIIAGLLRTSSASVRRSVWVLTLAAAASLPIGMATTPAWRLKVIPPVVTNSAIPSSASRSQLASGETRVEHDGSVVVTSGEASPAVSRGTSVTSAGDTWKLVALRTADARLVLLCVWLFGVVVVLGRMVAGFAMLRRLKGRSVAADATWSRLASDECHRISMERTVEVRISADVATPFAYGIVAPVVMLPEESTDWSHEHRTVVLRHEIAHVAAHDMGWNMAAGIACAIYWFHPLAWVAARNLRQEQERACDDRVLELGTPAADYASHLLDVAKSAKELGMSGFVSVAMARPSQLEGRLLAVLNETGRRGTLSRAGRLTAIAMSTSFVLAISALTLEARPAALVAGSMIPAPPVTQAYDSVVSQELRVEPGGVLTLDLKTGAGLTIVGTDESSIYMRAFLSGRDWYNTDVTLRRTNDGARVETRYIEQRRSQSSSNRIELAIPRRYSIRLHSAGGGLTLRDVSGEFSGTTGGGDIRIERATGDARISTGGGSIVVTNSRLSGSVGTGGGPVLIQGVEGGLVGSSGTGDVLYGRDGLTYSEVAGRDGGRHGSDGRYYLHKSGGGVSISKLDNGADINTGGGKIELGTVDGDLRAQTGGGDISVRSLRGSGTLSTGAGQVRVNVDGPGTHNVKVSSGYGKVVLYLPSNTSAELDIESGYTRENGRTRIDNDWGLPVTETTSWDNSMGTPRRFVRSRGTIGSGQGRITVRTTNGDVEIRRAR